MRQTQPAGSSAHVEQARYRHKSNAAQAEAKAAGRDDAAQRSSQQPGRRMAWRKHGCRGVDSAEASGPIGEGVPRPAEAFLAFWHCFWRGRHGESLPVALTLSHLSLSHGRLQ